MALSNVRKMIEEFLQDRASHYVCGAMSSADRENFEVLLLAQEELRQLVDQLQEVARQLALSQLPAGGPVPGTKLKARVLAEIARQGRPAARPALVVTGSNRLVQWISPEFTAMCGYSLAELRGKNLGPILQGERTDPAAVGRIRTALSTARPCAETIINYRKNGSAYRVAIEIGPILDDAGEVRWFVAREELIDPLAEARAA